MTLDVLFCKDIMVNVGNSPVRNFTLFPKHVTFTPRYGQFVLGNYFDDNSCYRNDYYPVQFFFKPGRSYITFKIL